MARSTISSNEAAAWGILGKVSMSSSSSSMKTTGFIWLSRPRIHLSAIVDRACMRMLRGSGDADIWFSKDKPYEALTAVPEGA